MGALRWWALDQKLSEKEGMLGKIPSELTR